MNIIYRYTEHRTGGGSHYQNITDEKALTINLKDTDYWTGVVDKIKIIDGQEYIVARRLKDNEPLMELDTPILYDSTLKVSWKAQQNVKKRSIVLDRITKYKLTDRMKRINEGTFLFDDKYYYYTNKKKVRQKGTQRFWMVKGFDDFYYRFLKVLLPEERVNAEDIMKRFENF
jgi:hypothetical protein